MASKENVQAATGGSASASGAGQHALVPRKGRGHPRGSKNRKTLMREAVEAAAVRECDARLRASRGPAIGMGVLNAALQGRRVLEEGEGSRPSLTPPSVQRAPEGAIIAPAQPQGAGGPLEFPIHEFFTNVVSDDHSRLPLPAQFNIIFSRYVRVSATIREASPCQRP